MSELAELGRKLFSHEGTEEIKIVDTERRIRGIHSGKVLFDTTEAKLVWEDKFFPQYWIPKSSFTNAAVLTDDKSVADTGSSTFTIRVEDQSVSALIVSSSFKGALRGYVKVEFKALDQWLEEQSQIIYHPRDPFHRVDVLPSGRRVKIEVDGVVLADTGSDGGVMSLWETNFPARWYLPRTAVNWEFFIESPTHTGCPYKGEASYYHAVVKDKRHEDIVWWYKFPLLESALIKGLLCFYPGKVDMWIDGRKR